MSALGWVAQFAVELEFLKAMRRYIMTGSAIDDARDTSPVTRGEAHGVWLTAGIHGPVFQQVPPQVGGRVAQRHDFGISAVR